MVRFLIPLAVLASMACGPRHPPLPDAGEDAGEDAGVDAGRPRGFDPPVGWMSAVPLDPDAGALTHLGISVASAPDQYGQPIIAGVLDDPNGDGVRLDTRVFFTRWSGADAGFFEPVRTVEIVGEIGLDAPNRQVSVARDSSTGRIGVAYVKGADIRFAYTDDEGLNFSLITLANGGSVGDSSNPAIALTGNYLHVAWLGGGLVHWARRGGGGNNPAALSGDAPLPSGYEAIFPGPLSLALDSAGNPGLAYLVQKSSGMTVGVAFWRPNTSTAALIGEVTRGSGATAGREPSVTLTFSGVLPRVAYHLRDLAVAPTNDNTPELFYATANDAAGTGWATPVAIPRNTDGAKYNSTRHFQGVVADASGKAVVAGYFASNGTVGTQCGGPKLARSNDGLSFITCMPLASPLNFAGEYLTLWSHAPNKLTLIFYLDARTNPTLRPGVVMWREP